MLSIRNKHLILIITIIAVLVSSIWLYAGHFLLAVLRSNHLNSDRLDACLSLFKNPDNDTPEVKDEPAKLEPVQQPPPVQYKHISTVINGNKQEINLLEIDPGNKKIEIKPVLSYDSVFGFEKLSVMYKRSNAYAAVNAGFFYEFGNPGGMVAIDGKLITKSTGKNPVFFINNGRAVLREIDTRIWAECSGKKFSVNNINAFGGPGETLLFTRDYGTDNRVKKKNTSLTIENNLIAGITVSSDKTDIPENGYVLTFLEPVKKDFMGSNFKTGDRIEFTYEPKLEESTQAYECGSWIVKNGDIVIGDKDEWVGALTNWDPRTAVGIKNDGKVILMTVDGRQPGYSIGLTARELGRFFLDNGVKDAAMLDGGASTEMIVDGKIVSKPSFKGEERLLGGAIVVKKIDKPQ